VSQDPSWGGSSVGEAQAPLIETKKQNQGGPLSQPRLFYRAKGATIAAAAAVPPKQHAYHRTPGLASSQ
jgi:hypothetical protein